MRHLELDAEGTVINVIVWDGTTPYNPEGVAQIVPAPADIPVSFGWRLVDGGWVEPQSNG